MSLMSPWTKENSVEDIKKSWNQWINNKQASKILGTAYKSKSRGRNPNLQATRVQYGWMKQQTLLSLSLLSALGHYGNSHDAKGHTPTGEASGGSSEPDFGEC
ncbi:hypothetical protein STEG23_006499 [Scotinomys teguina]